VPRSLKHKILFLTDNIHAVNYHNALQLLPKLSVLGALCSLTYNLKMTFCGSWRCFCLRVWEIKLPGEQHTMSYSASFYSNTCKLMQFLFLLPCWSFSWRNASIWTLHNPVVTLGNLRLAFRQLYFMCTKCIHELCIFLIIRCITSLYSRKWMDFITETGCVSCTAWYRSFNTNQVSVLN
jgi:hypothetical protein